MALQKGEEKSIMKGNVLKLGDQILKNQLLLAPLERISYLSFRNLCYGNGASLTFTEMIRAKSITDGYNVINMIDTIDPQTNTGLQLVTKDSRELTDCLNYIEFCILSGRNTHWRNISTTDLNFGCPKPSIKNQI